MKTTKCRWLLLALPALLLAACSKDDDVMEEDPFVDGIVLIDGTHNGTLLKTTSKVLNPAACINLFDSLSAADSLAIISSSEICIVLDGKYLTDPALGTALKEAWNTFYASYAHKLLLVYDGSQASSDLTAQVAGFYSSPGYYVRSFGRGGVYSQLIEPALMSESRLAQTIDEVRDKRAQGISAMGTNQEVMKQYSFVRPLRFSYHRPDNRELGDESLDSFVTGQAVEAISPGMRSQSVFGDFMIRYTIYAMDGYKDHFLLVEVGGAGFTANILRRVQSYKFTYEGFSYDTYTAHSRNFVRQYGVHIKLQGRDQIPVSIQALPSVINGSQNVSESKSSSIGFDVSKDGPALSGSFKIDNSVAYDQPSFSTKPISSDNATDKTHMYEWETKPVTGYNGVNAWEKTDLDINNLFNIYIYDSYKRSYRAIMYNLSNPKLFPIPFYSFSPQVSLLSHIKEDEVTVETGVSVVLQDDAYDPRKKEHTRFVSTRDVKETVKIIFSDDSVFWQ